MKKSKKYINANFISGFLSLNKSFSISREILFGHQSLKSLRSILKSTLPEGNKYIKTNEIALALQTLINEGIIVESGGFCIIKANIKGDYDIKNMVSLTQYLLDMVPVYPENNNTWNSFSELEEFITEYIKMAQFSENCNPEQMQIVNRFIEYLIFSGQYKKGITNLNRIKKTLIKIPDNLAQKAVIIGYKAEIYRITGKNERAEKLLRPIVNQLEKNALKHQLQLARLYTTLGLVLLYDDKLRFSDAENYLRRALLIRQINLGEEHISTVTSHICLAEYFVQLCDGTKAFEHIGKIENNPSFCNNKFYSAWAADVKGLASYFKNNLEDAIQYCEKGLIVRRKFLTKEHPLLLESLHNMGYLLFLSRKPQEAFEYLNQTYSNFKKVYSPEHQNYTITVGVYAMCNQIMNKIEAAEEILLNEVDAILTYPRENYKLFGTAFELLMEHFRRENNLDKEEKLTVEYIKILKSRSVVYDQKYMNVLNRYFKIIKDRHKFEDVPWVKTELSEFLYIDLQNQIKTKTITSNLLNIYGVKFKNEYNDYGRAEECYIKALELNPGDSTTYSNYALLLTSIKKEDDRAEVFYLKSLELDANNEVTFGNYAFFMQNARRKFEEAELCYNQAIILNGNERCNLANFASLKLIQGDFSEAKKLASQSLKLCIPSPNRHMARSLFCLLVIRIFECKNYDDLLGHLKFLFNYGMEHVSWDNRELLAFTKKILNKAEYNFVRIIFETISDYSCMEKLEKMEYWKRINPLPFVNNYKSPLE